MFTGIRHECTCPDTEANPFGTLNAVNDQFQSLTFTNQTYEFTNVALLAIQIGAMLS